MIFVLFTAVMCEFFKTHHKQLESKNTGKPHRKMTGAVRAPQKKDKFYIPTNIAHTMRCILPRLPRPPESQNMIILLLALLLLLVTAVLAGSMPLWSDDFNDNSLNTSLWTPDVVGTGDSFAETNGEAVFTTRGNSTTSCHSYIVSRPFSVTNFENITISGRWKTGSTTHRVVILLYDAEDPSKSASVQYDAWSQVLRYFLNNTEVSTGGRGRPTSYVDFSLRVYPDGYAYYENGALKQEISGTAFPGTTSYQLKIGAWEYSAITSSCYFDDIAVWADTRQPEMRANFTANATSGTAPLAVGFTDLSTGEPIRWSWVFGDGNTSSDRNPIFEYTIPGIYTVNLSVMDADEQWSSVSKPDYIAVTAPPEPLTANFTANVTASDSPLAVGFTDLSTGEPIRWSWVFGDGNTSSDRNPIFEYTIPGIYTVNLSVMDADEQWSTLSKSDYITVTEPPEPLAANFTANVTAGELPLTVGFTDLSTGNPINWSWDFGDGGTSTLSGPEHTYMAVGTYTVNLTVEDTDGHIDTISKLDYITVTAPPEPLAANFTANVTSGDYPLAVQFTDLSEGNVTAWLWTFGDGGTSTLPGPEHTYTAAGTYSVVLHVYDADGNTDTIQRANYIAVSGPPNPDPGDGGVPAIIPQTTVTPTPTPTEIVLRKLVENINTGEKFQTIQAALNDTDTVDGDVIVVESGIFTGPIEVDKAVTIRSASGADETRLVASDSVGSRLTPVVLILSSRVTIQGFTITGTADAPAVVVAGGEKCSVEDNVISEAKAGILITGSTRPQSTTTERLALSSSRTMGDHTVSNNRILDCTDGIALSGTSKNTISDNTVARSAGAALSLESGSNSNRIDGNTFTDCSVGVNVSASTGNVVWNNLFRNGLDYLGDSSANIWNATKASGKNIIGGPYIGGNYWTGYDGDDTDGDGLGDTGLPFGPGDRHPLLTAPVTDQDTGKTYLSIGAAVADPKTLDGHTILCRPSRYTENVVIDKGVHVVADGGTGTIAPAERDRPAVVLRAPGALIEGFAIEGMGSGSEAEGVLIGAPDTVVTDCRITRFPTGIVVEQESKDGEGLFGFIFEQKDERPVTITNNTIVENDIGVRIVAATGGTFTGNILSQNAAGLVLEEGADSTAVANNTFTGQKHQAILLKGSSANTVSGNTIQENAEGIGLEAATQNTVRSNRISENELGIACRGTSGSLIYDNYLANDVNAVSDGSDRWAVSKEDGDLIDSTNIMGGGTLGGNYWSDYAGTDDDRDGFGDVKYHIAEDAADLRPLVVLPVLNLDTGISYPTIGAAIDDARTNDGDVIVLGAGTYRENVVVTKSLTIRTDGSGVRPVIAAGNRDGNAFAVAAPDVTVQNLTLSGATGEGAAGVALIDASGCTLEGLAIRSNAIGVLLQGAADNTIRSSTIAGNGQGIAVYGSDGNEVYDNYFSNDQNTAGDTSTNTWYLAAGSPGPSGPNIVGGPSVGGNFWSDYTGADTNGDGFGDTLSPYVPEGNVASGVSGSAEWLGTSGDRRPLAVTMPAEIHIDGNANFTRANGVLSGTGTAADPYVIEGYTLDFRTTLHPGGGGTYPIWIENTDAHFVIRNCRVNSRGLAGVYLDNVANGRIEGVTHSGTSLAGGSGVVLADTRNTVVTGCRFHIVYPSAGSCGIIVGNSNGNTVTGNTLSMPALSGNSQTSDGIRISGSPGNSVTGNNVTGFGRGGIWIVSSSGCTIEENAVAGNDAGIVALSSPGTVISGNTASGNDVPGTNAINLGSWQRTEWSAESLGTGGAGVVVCESDGSTVAENTVSGNTDGILLLLTAGTAVTGNVVTGNGGQGGIVVDAGSTGTIVSNNTVLSNTAGVVIARYSTANTIEDNFIGSGSAAQGTGVRLADVNGNTITGNSLIDNTVGLSTRLGENLVYNNIFDSAVSMGTSGVVNVRGEYWSGHPTDQNRYNITPTAGENILGGSAVGGNYWSDYSGADMNGDGLADSPVPFNGDWHPILNSETIHIRTNNEFTAEHGVSGGDGTAASPYVIEGLTVSARTGNGIWIENTDRFFVISNCSVEGGSVYGTSGVRLENLTNGRVTGLATSGNGRSIELDNVTGVVIERCRSTGDGDGLVISGSGGVTVAGTNVSGADTGIAAVRSAGILISGCTVSACAKDGIVIENTTAAGVDGCSVEGNHGAGIAISGSAGVSVRNTSVTANNQAAFSLGRPDKAGIAASATTVLVLANNTLSRNENHAIRIGGCTNVTVESNRIGGTYWGGAIQPSAVLIGTSAQVTVRNNTVTGTPGIGVSAVRSGVSIDENWISGNTCGIGLNGAGGDVSGNYVSGGATGIRIGPDIPAGGMQAVVDGNTVTGCTGDGVSLSAAPFSLSGNRIAGCGNAISVAGGAAGTISNVSMYGSSGAALEAPGWSGAAAVPVVNPYTGENAAPDAEPESAFAASNVTVSDDIGRGSPLLRAAVIDISSTAGEGGSAVGGTMSVRVAADAAAGLAHQRLLMTDRTDGLTYVLADGQVSGNAVDTAIIYDVLPLNDSRYDILYEVTDTAGRTVSGYAATDVRNVNIRILNMTTTTAERIYTFHRYPDTGGTADLSEIAAENDRGSFVYVSLKNEGIEGGPCRLAIDVPDYLENVTGAPVKYLWLEPGEELNVTFYLPLTRYTFEEGWIPADPAVFPADRQLPITASARSVPSSLLFDEQEGSIAFALGPIFVFEPQDGYTLVSSIARSGDGSAPYDGDGDGVIEAAENHHFRLAFTNVGDEPANITEFIFVEQIACNSSKYETAYPESDYISDTADYYPGMSFSNPQSYYAPEFWDQSGTGLFGLLYPQGTTSVDGAPVSGANTYLRKYLYNGYKDWWFDEPELGFFPPDDYAGEVDAYIMPKYTPAGETAGYHYYGPSLNRIPFSVRALEKDFFPATFTLKGGDITVRTFAADPEDGTVQLTVRNANEDVYFEYRADSVYDPSPEGYAWYHVVPPEYTFNAFVDDARDPTKSVPQMDVDFGVRWSLWANELQLGMIGLEAAVNIILDEATGGAIQVEFGDTVMSATNTLLQVMNAAESIENGVQPIVVIDGVTFDQAKLDALAAEGLDDAYFDRVRSGDVDAGTITTFIGAVKSDPDLREVFGREVLKVIARNLGLTELYERLTDPEAAAEADFDELKQMLLDSLVSDESLTSAEADQIGQVADAALVFVDMGGWAFNNVAASGTEEVTISVVDPPGTLSTSFAVKDTPYIGSLTGSGSAGGAGTMNVTVDPDGMVAIHGEYAVPTNVTGLDTSIFREMTLAIRGERQNGAMDGSATVTLVPDPSGALDAAIAFRNPAVRTAMLGQHFAELGSTTLTEENGEIVVTGEGVLRADQRDEAIGTEMRIGKDVTVCTVDKLGRYGEIVNGSVALDLRFGAIAGVSPANTTLAIVLPPGSTLSSALPFVQDGDTYRLDALPEDLSMSAAIPAYPPWALPAAAVIAAAGLAAASLLVMRGRGKR